MGRAGGRPVDSSASLVEALRTVVLPDGPGHAYVGGEHAMVRGLRGYLVERGMTPESIDAKPYWRMGRQNAAHGEPDRELTVGHEARSWITAPRCSTGAAHLPEEAESDSVDLTAQVSLPAVWTAAVAGRPARRILRGPDGTWLAAADVLESPAVVAGRFFAAGARPGDRVLMGAPTSSSFVVAHCAALRAGLVVVPVNAGCHARELEAVILEARPRLAVLGSEHLREAAADDGPPRGGDHAHGAARRRPPAPARWRRSAGPRHADLHVRHHRRTQGCRAVARQPVGQAPRRSDSPGDGVATTT